MAKDVCEELTERSGDGTETGEQLARGVAVQRRTGSAAGDSDSLHLAGTVVLRAMKAGEENDWSELLKV